LENAYDSCSDVEESRQPHRRELAPVRANGAKLGRNEGYAREVLHDPVPADVVFIRYRILECACSMLIDIVVSNVRDRLKTALRP
jgi:hypothetical protein